MKSYIVEIREIFVYRVPIKAKSRKSAEERGANFLWEDIARTGDKDTYFIHDELESIAVEVTP